MRKQDVRSRNEVSKRWHRFVKPLRYLCVTKKRKKNKKTLRTISITYRFFSFFTNRVEGTSRIIEVQRVHCPSGLFDTYDDNIPASSLVYSSRPRTDPRGWNITQLPRARAEARRIIGISDGHVTRFGSRFHGNHGRALNSAAPLYPFFAAFLRRPRSPPSPSLPSLQFGSCIIHSRSPTSPRHPPIRVITAEKANSA